MKFIIIETTFKTLSKAKKLANLLLKEKLAACVQLSEIVSLYNWKNKIEEEKEILVTIKTSKKLYSKISKIIENNHEYQLPQIISKEINSGLEQYLKWIESNIK